MLIVKKISEGEVSLFNEKRENLAEENRSTAGES